jgi:cell division protein FtsI (penicillin-binding protein 3)
VVRTSDTILQRRRLGYLSGTLVVFGVLLFVRLVDLQLVQHGQYAKQASNEQSRKFEIPATRGVIYVQDGDGTISPIVQNQTLQTLYADPRFVGNKSAAAQKLAALTGGSAPKYLAALDNGIDYAVLDTKLPQNIADKINTLKMPGVATAGQDYRAYPEGDLAAQVLGFVNAQGVGQYGLEGYFNAQLSGTPGKLFAKTDAFGIPIATADNVDQPAVNGTNYVLTIDRNIQAMAEQELAAQVKSVKAKSGSVVVLDPTNGNVLAMANYPTYDPSQYNLQTDYSVFQNQVVSNAFEPGSGMKVFTMATGLDQGKVTPNTTYDDPGCYTIDTDKVCDAKGDQPGNNKTMTVVLRDSLNTGAMFVLRMLSGSPTSFTLAGKQLLYNYFTKHFGFGSLTGIQQSDEAAGQVNLASNAAGNNVNYANMTFGQGMTTTMIQMAAAMAGIAEGGTVYKPNLVAGTMNADGSINAVAPKIARSHILSPTAISNLNQMLQVVVQHGSGYIAADMNPGYAIAGKTGTAEIANPNGGGYLVGANIGSFIGFAPADKPKFVVMVRLNDPSVNCDSQECGYAEYTTVPLFGEICKWLFKYYGIPPGT